MEVLVDQLRLKSIGFVERPDKIRICESFFGSSVARLRIQVRRFQSSRQDLGAQGASIGRFHSFADPLSRLLKNSRDDHLVLVHIASRFPIIIGHWSDVDLVVLCTKRNNLIATQFTAPCVCDVVVRVDSVGALEAQARHVGITRDVPTARLRAARSHLGRLGWLVPLAVHVLPDSSEAEHL